MTNEQILKMAIEKATRNGFKYEPYLYSDGVHRVVTKVNEFYIFRQIIFSHNFAKAFWGTGGIEQFLPDYSDEHRFFGGKLCYPYNEGSGMTYKVATWKYHLMKMVLEEDPIKYLEKFI